MIASRFFVNARVKGLGLIVALQGAKFGFSFGIFLFHEHIWTFPNVGEFLGGNLFSRFGSSVQVFHAFAFEQGTFVEDEIFAVLVLLLHDLLLLVFHFLFAYFAMTLVLVAGIHVHLESTLSKGAVTIRTFFQS